MNRVVLLGRLAGPPKIAYTPCGVAVATLRLLVLRDPVAPRKVPVTDQRDCVAGDEPDEPAGFHPHDAV